MKVLIVGRGGREHALAAAAAADGAEVVVVPGNPGIPWSRPDVDPLDPPVQSPLWTVGTKADLAPVRAHYVLSVETGIGVDALLVALAGFAETAAGAGAPALVSRERDLVALQSAQQALDRFISDGATDEIAAEHLRQASLALERLLGRIDTEQVLDRLFASFCIGK